LWQGKSKLQIAKLIAHDGPLQAWQIAERLRLKWDLVDRCLQDGDYFERSNSRWSVTNRAFTEAMNVDFLPRVISHPKATRQYLETMSEAEIEVLQPQPRRCKGACRELLTYADFEVTTEKGHRVHRTQCRKCMATYYSAISAPLKTRIKIATVIADHGPLDLATLSRAVGLSPRVAHRLLRHVWFELASGLWQVTPAAREAFIKRAALGFENRGKQ
jgi:hypothetical protein